MLSEAEAAAWFDGRATEIDCRTALVDGSKQELAADTLRLTNFGARTLDRRLLFLVPAFVGLNHPNWFTPELTFVRSIAIDEDDVAAIAEVRATVERGGSGVEVACSSAAFANANHGLQCGMISPSTVRFGILRLPSMPRITAG